MAIRNKLLLSTSSVLVLLGADIAEAGVIDVVNNSNYFQNGELRSNEVDDEGNPIIAGTSLNREDAILFEVEDDPAAIVEVSGFSGTPFTLQGNVQLLNAVAMSGGGTLKINGYLTEDSSGGGSYSDFSNVSLVVNKYEVDEQDPANGLIRLNNDISLGNTVLNEGSNIELSGNQRTINLSSVMTLSGGNAVLGDSEGTLLNFVGDGDDTIDVKDSLAVDNNVHSVAMNGVSFHNEGNSIFNQKVSFGAETINEGTLTINDSADFGDQVNNNGNIIVNGTADFNLYTENNGTVNVKESADFNNDVLNNGNLIVGKDAHFYSVVSNTGSSSMTIGGVAKFDGNLSNEGTSKLTLNNGGSFDSINNKDYSIVTVNGGAVYNETVSNNDHAKLIANGVSDFYKSVTNNGSSSIVLNGKANFSETVSNMDNASVVANQEAYFYKNVDNTQNAKMTFNDKVYFYKNFDNLDYAELKTNDQTEFAGVVTNSGDTVMTLGGTTIFNNKVINSGNSIINLSGKTTFTSSTADFYNNDDGQANISGENLFQKVHNYGTMNFNAYANLSNRLNNYGSITASSGASIAEVMNMSDANINIDGKADFNGAIDNYGSVFLTGEADFADAITNTGTFSSTAKNNFSDNVVNSNTGIMSLRDVNFKSSSYSLSNSGTLNLIDSNLNSNIDNIGILNLYGDIILGENYISSGSIAAKQGAAVNLGNRTLEYTGGNQIVFSDDSAVKFDINSPIENVQSGGIIKGNVKLEGNVSLQPTFAFGVSDGSYSFVNGSVNSSLGAWTDYNNNPLYNVSVAANNTTLNFTKKSNDDIAEYFGATSEQVEALEAVLSGQSSDAGFNQVAGNINSMLQSQDNEQIAHALKMVKSVSPETSPMVQQAATETSAQIFDVVGARLANRPVAKWSYNRGMSSGDYNFEEGAAWVQGMGSKSELKDSDKTNGFETTTSGVAMGFEKQANENIRVGVGYSYSQTDIDSELRNADVNTHSAIFYTEYKHPRFFMNATAIYGWSNYKENSLAASADYVVESLGLQAMAGYYGLNTGIVRFIPEIGARYIHTKQHDYTNSIGVQYNNLSNDLLTGIVGARITAIGGNNNGLRIIPEAKIAFTYDIENGEDKEALVTLPNGTSYSVRGKALNRFGVEFGAGITAEINEKVDLSVGYEGRYRKDFTDHTGLIKGKYKF